MVRITGVVCAVAATALLVGATSATAKGGSRAKIGVAHCSPGATAKIKAKNDSGAIEVEFEVDQNRNGVRWSWRIARDGKTVRSGATRTHAPSGSFSVERRIANPAGVNRVTFRAVSSGGKVCTGRVSV